jgi:hypothetical protein
VVANSAFLLADKSSIGTKSASSSPNASD